MTEEQIKCYLCGGDAIQYEENPQSRTVEIHCKKFDVIYKLGKQARKFYLKRPDGQENLNEMDKEKLCKYILKKYDPDTGKPVPLNVEDIRRITGK